MAALTLNVWTSWPEKLVSHSPPWVSNETSHTKAHGTRRRPRGVYETTAWTSFHHISNGRMSSSLLHVLPSSPLEPPVHGHQKPIFLDTFTPAWGAVLAARRPKDISSLCTLTTDFIKVCAASGSFAGTPTSSNATILASVVRLNSAYGLIF